MYFTSLFRVRGSTEVYIVKFTGICDDVFVTPFSPRVQFVTEKDASRARRGELGRTIFVLEGFGLHEVNEAAEGVELVLEFVWWEAKFINTLAVSMLSDVCAKAVVWC